MKLKVENIETLCNNERRVSASILDGSQSISDISIDTGLHFKDVIHSLGTLYNKGYLVLSRQNGKTGGDIAYDTMKRS